MKAITMAICAGILFAATGCKGGAEPWPDEAGMDKEGKQALMSAKMLFGQMAKVSGQEAPNTINVEAIAKAYLERVDVEVAALDGDREAVLRKFTGYMHRIDEAFALTMASGCDVNGDRLVSKPEAYEFSLDEDAIGELFMNPNGGHKGMDYALEVQSKAFLRIYDKNNNGKLDKAEIDEFGIEYSTEFDKNKDSAYSESEFIQLNKHLTKTAISEEWPK